VEFEPQVDLLLKEFQSVGRPMAVVSLSPHTDLALEDRGISARTISSYIAKDRIEELGERNFAIVEAITRSLDREIHAVLQQKDVLPFRPAWCNYFYLKILFDSISIPLLEIESVLRAEEPDEVYSFAPVQSPILPDLSWGLESTYSHAIRVLCSELGNHHREIGWQVPRRLPPVLPPRSLARMVFHRTKDIPWLGRLSAIARAAKNSGRRRRIPALLRRRRGQGRDRPWVFFSDEYNMGPILVEAIEKTDRPIFLWRDEAGPVAIRKSSNHDPGSGAPSQMAGLVQELRVAWTGMRVDREFRAALRQDGRDMFPVLEDRLARQFVEGTVEATQVFCKTTDWVAKERPAAALFSVAATVRQRAAAMACRMAGVPVVISPHGSAGHVEQRILYYLDYAIADVYLAYGPGMAAHIRSAYGVPPAIVAVGAPMIDRLGARQRSREALCRALHLDPTRKVVMYVITAMDSTHRYVGRRQAHDCEALRIQREIVSVFPKHPQIQFILKAHPERGEIGERVSPIETILRRMQLPNVRVVLQPSFPELVNLPDALIVDLPSTPVFEFAARAARIYSFNDTLRWDPHGLESFQRRAFATSDLTRFVHQLDADLASGRAFAYENVDPTFLRDFVLPVPGRSSEMAVDAVEEACGQKRY
jgi:hypothetical protein